MLITRVAAVIIVLAVVVIFILIAAIGLTSGKPEMPEMFITIVVVLVSTFYKSPWNYDHIVFFSSINYFGKFCFKKGCHIFRIANMIGVLGLSSSLLSAYFKLKKWI